MITSRFLYAVVAIHLFLTALYATHFVEWGPSNMLAKTSFAWGEFTGSSNIYSFFAPYVGEQTNVIYTVVDSSGSQQVYRLTGHSREILNRLNTAYNFLSLSETHDVLCQSFAIQVFSRFPSASIVRVHIIKQTMPSMEQQKAGGQIRWQTMFYKDYSRTSGHEPTKQ